MSEATPKTNIETLIAVLREVGNFSDDEILNIFEKVSRGASIAEIMKIPSESLQAGYAMACSLFASRNYSDAETLFRTLCMYDEQNAKNWIGLGLCCEKRDELYMALSAYAKAADLQESKYPKALYLVASCLHRLNNDGASKIIAERAVAAPATDPDSERYRSLTKELLSSLAKE